MNNKELFAGIDIGGTKVAIGLFDENASMLYRARKATLKAKNAQELRKFLLDFLCETVSEADKKGCIGGEKLKGIGIGVPAPVNQRTGKILFTPNIPKLTELNLLEDFKNYFRVRTAVDNDANCAALAEHRYGAGRGTDNMAYVTISTGIGGGLILNGKLFRGTNGFAGEVGPCDHGYAQRCCMRLREQRLRGGVSLRGESRKISENANKKWETYYYKKISRDGGNIKRSIYERRYACPRNIFSDY